MKENIYIAITTVGALNAMQEIIEGLRKALEEIIEREGVTE